MASTPSFIGTPVIERGRISAANTNRDGTGTLVNVGAAAPATGLRVDSVIVQATSATTAGMVRLYVNDGTNARLFLEVAVTAITPSGTTKAFWYEVVFPRGIVLPSGYTLQASTHNAEMFDITAFGGSF